MIKRVMTYGTFDMFHYGHMEFLRRAAGLGDELVVAVSTDKFNEEQKHKKALLPFVKRKQCVEQMKCVSCAVEESKWEQKAPDIMKYGISTMVFGEDWAGEFDYLRNYGVNVVYLSRTPGISSTAIRKAIKSENKIAEEKNGTHVE